MKNKIKEEWKVNTDKGMNLYFISAKHRRASNFLHFNNDTI